MVQNIKCSRCFLIKRETAKKMCSGCYQATLYGRETTHERLKRENFESNGRFFLGKNFEVDREDFHRLKGFLWYELSTGYAFNNPLGLLHRNILKIDNIIDHKDRDIKNNRRDNLRDGVRVNNYNKRTRFEKNDFIGVFLLKTGKWMAQVGYNGKSVFLGNFTNKIEAAKAVYDWALSKKLEEFYKNPFFDK